MNTVELTLLQIRVRRWVLLSWSLLLILVWQRQLHQGLTWQQLGWSIGFSLPLWACLPGLWRGKRYTHQWASLCVLPYFIVGVTESVANAAHRTWSLWLLGAALLWFFALLAFVRISRADLVI